MNQDQRSILSAIEKTRLALLQARTERQAACFERKLVTLTSRLQSSMGAEAWANWQIAEAVYA